MALFTWRDEFAFVSENSVLTTLSGSMKEFVEGFPAEEFLEIFYFHGVTLSACEFPSNRASDSSTFTIGSGANK